MITVAAYFYIFETISLVKKVTINFDPAIEAIAIEINLKKRKWIQLADIIHTKI